MAELHEKQRQEAKTQEDLEDLKSLLNQEKDNLAEITRECTRLRSLCEDKDTSLQVSNVLLFYKTIIIFIILCFVTDVGGSKLFKDVLMEKRTLEAKLLQLSNQTLQNNTKTDGLGTNNQVILFAEKNLCKTASVFYQLQYYCSIYVLHITIFWILVAADNEKAS